MSIVSGGWSFFFFQAEDGIRDLVRSRGLGDVYKRQAFIVCSLFSACSKTIDDLLSKTSSVTSIASIPNLSLIHI
mgnify:CR=1 FL=1